MKNQIYVDGTNKMLVMTKAYFKRACLFGTKEYYALREAQTENEGYEIVFQYKASGKKTYSDLTFKRMAEYIQTQPDAEQRMFEFEAVKKIAKAKGSLYPLTKKWFLLTYPLFKESDVSAEEAKTPLDVLKKAAEEEARKKLAVLSAGTDADLLAAS